MMNFWDKITGNDMTKELKAFDLRAKKLPADYQETWENICLNLWPHSDLTGRNIIPILDDVLNMLEVAAMDGQRIQEIFGDDIKGFCSALAGIDGAQDIRDKWRNQLNDNIAKKLRKQEG